MSVKIWSFLFFDSESQNCLYYFLAEQVIKIQNLSCELATMKDVNLLNEWLNVHNHKAGFYNLQKIFMIIFISSSSFQS